MKISNHLDKLYELGFEITLDWKSEFCVYYNANDVIPPILILRCSYYKSSSAYTFEDMIECCCDIFYNWYNKNIKIIKNFDVDYDKQTLDKLEDCSVGDVTKMVARDLNLTDLLDMFDKYNKKNSD